MEWFEVSNSNEVDSPALLVFPDRVKKNIEILKRLLPDMKRLRPHVKTHKSTEVTKILIEAGFTQFKCATIAEAEMLAEAKAADVLLAYQPIGPKAERLAALVKAFPKTKFSCLVDNEKSAAELNAVFTKLNRDVIASEERTKQSSSKKEIASLSLAMTNPYRLEVYIDLNIGMNRTGIKPDMNAEALYRKCQSMDGIISVGLHAYDGHLRDEDLQVRTEKCNQGFALVIEMQKNLMNDGFEEPIIVVGGTTTFPIHAQREKVVCSPGTFIYWDKGYHDRFKEQHFEFAAVLMTRVISKPTTDSICVDLGHKAVASENTLANRVHFLNANNLEPIGHSEEHLVLKVNGENNYNVGDVLYGIPFHICPTVALHDAVTVITNHNSIDRWLNLSRNRKIIY